MEREKEKQNTWNVWAVDKNRADKVAHTKAADPIPEIMPNAVLLPLSGMLSAWKNRGLKTGCSAKHEIVILQLVTS